MVTFKKGNMFDEPGADVLVNTVNCVGTMGKGVALEFGKRYPVMLAAYRDYCLRGYLVPGHYFAWTAVDGKIILNVATKDHWRTDSKYKYIIRILLTLVDLSTPADQLLGKKTIVMPALGCGNGNLNWGFVKTLMIEYLEPTAGNFVVYEPM